MVAVELLGLSSIDLEKAETSATQVYKIIKDGIISLALKPGTTMSEKEIGTGLHVSRTPVREAFIRLSREGLVKVYPQRGTIVSYININQAFQERMIREALEKEALRIFIQHKDDTALAELKAVLDRNKKAIEIDKNDDIWQCDLDFHRVFFESTDNTLSEDIIENYSVNYFRMRRMNLETDKIIQKSTIDEHEAIYKYAKQGDIGEATRVLLIHLRKLKNDVFTLLKLHPDYFEDADMIQDIVSRRMI